MLIIALVLAVIGLAALVTAVVTSNELIAWVCIGASVLGVVLLIVDALRERSRSGRTAGAAAAGSGDDGSDADADQSADEGRAADEVDEEYDSSRDTQVIAAVQDTAEVDADEPVVDYPEDAVEVENAASAEAEVAEVADGAETTSDAETSQATPTASDAESEERKN